jgi:hypothetical protein
MVTFWLQVVVGLLFLAFGLLALAVAGAVRASAPARRAAWWMTGGVFSLHAVNILLQNAWGGWAMAAGNDSAIMRAYVENAPLLNHSRTASLSAYFALLLTVALLPLAQRWVVPLSFGAIIGATAVGAFLARGDGPNGGERHYRSIVAFDALELILVLSVLFILLVRDTVDRLLWLALVAYALTIALNVLFFSPLGLQAIGGGWAPPVWMIQAYRTPACLAMCVAAFQRLRLARRGIDVPALFEPLGRAKPPPPLLE